MLDIYDHALAAILLLLIPPRAWLSFRALLRAAPEDRSRLRRRLYLSATISQWALAVFLIAHWVRSGRDWPQLGLVPVITPGAIGVASGLLLVVTLMILQVRRADPAIGMERARARLEHVRVMLPHSAPELRLFRMLSITAGICEELLFRGFVIWYLAHFMGLIQAALLSSLSFGVGHAYQGLRYVLITGLVGAFMAGIYLISGSLVLPMLTHALMDLYSGSIGYRLVTQDASRHAAGLDAAVSGRPGR